MRWSASSARWRCTRRSIDAERISEVITRLIFFHCSPCGDRMEPLYPKLNNSVADVRGRDAKTASFFLKTSRAISGQATTTTWTAPRRRHRMLVCMSLRRPWIHRNTGLFDTTQCRLPMIGNPAGPGGSWCSCVFLDDVALVR